MNATLRYAMYYLPNSWPLQPIAWSEALRDHFPRYAGWLLVAMIDLPD